MSANRPDLPTLPHVRGRYRPDFPLHHMTWFRAGGQAEILYKPADLEDLSRFLKQRSASLAYTLIGAGSNVLVRDGGIPGVVIRLSKGFHAMQLLDHHKVDVGAGALNATFVQFCISNDLGGFEFLSGIPGSIGGGLRMNAGAHGVEIKDRLICAHVMDPRGTLHRLTPEELGYTYRSCSLPKEWIFIGARFQGQSSSSHAIQETLCSLRDQREAAQPLRTQTGGSTFKNPKGDRKAWELIDAAGCRGLRIGDAQLSQKHCNFMINTGQATATDLERLGEEVRQRVLRHTGFTLEWEIERLGIAMRSLAP